LGTLVADVLELLVQCIAQLPLTQKTVLVMYYHENPDLAEIAAYLDLTECEIERIRAETVGLLQTMLAGQIGLRELPVSLEQPRDADGIGFLVNGR
jgi:DNA-directed RNA polymerase specialized sigma24 family protein